MVGWVRAVGFSQFWSDSVETWTVRGDRRCSCRGVVGGSWRSVLAEHGPVLDDSVDVISFTDDGELKGLSIEGSDVRRTPRLVVGAVLIREVGYSAEGKGGSLSSGSGGRRGTPRLVLLSFVFLVLERS